MDYMQQVQRTVSLNSYEQHSTPPQNVAHHSSSVQKQLDDLKEIVEVQKNHLERFQQINKNRLYSLEKEVSELREKLGKTTEIIERINDVEVVQRTRDALSSRRDKPPADKPIDRNGVAPKDVQIDKIFNFSGKRF